MPMPMPMPMPTMIVSLLHESNVESFIAICGRPLALTHESSFVHVHVHAHALQESNVEPFIALGLVTVHALAERSEEFSNEMNLGRRWYER